MISQRSIRNATLFLAALLMTAGIRVRAQSDISLKGAWEYSSPGTSVKKVVAATDNYLVQAVYDTAGGRFIESLGGPYSVSGGAINVTLDFHSGNHGLAGKSYSLPVEINGHALTLTNEYGGKEAWRQIDGGQGELAGCWQITGRQQNNEMHTLPDGDRKTLKILSGTRFEWAAFNTATGDFSGCGGGHYTFENGKYTEHIDFFSRDASRVGMSLSFDDKVQDSLWYHKGKSTKGDPVYEIWKLR